MPRKGLLTDDDAGAGLHIGMVFQSGALFDSLTVGENVGFLLYEHSHLPHDHIQARCCGVIPCQCGTCREKLSAIRTPDGHVIS